jgi:hypothetical protein
MKKAILSILSAFLVGTSFSQYLCFQESNPVQSLPDNFFMTMFNDTDISPNQTIFTDLNMDGHLDLILVGNGVYAMSPSGTKFYFYLNDGNGNYNLTPTPQFVNGTLQNRVCAVADVDGDSDEDLLIIGNQPNLSFLYENDGAGNFTAVSGSVFESINLSAYNKITAPVFGDIDGDGDQDVIIGNRFYFNDGTGIFTLSFIPLNDLSTSFMPEITVFEVNGSGDIDIVLTGRDASSNAVSRVYINNGGGLFTANPTNPFISVTDGYLDHADIDGDGDEDVIITGINSILHESQTTLYKNDGAGNFTIVNNTPFFPSSYGKVLFTDINNDGSEDVFLTGGNFSDTSSVIAPACYSKYYTNDGAGNFTLVNGTPFEGISGTAGVGDIDGDNLKETIIVGQRVFDNSGIQSISKMFTVDFCTTPPNGIFVNTYTAPSSLNGCDGILYISAQGIANYTFDLQNGSPVISSLTGIETVPGLCPGIYSLFSAGGNGDTLTSTFVIASDSSYILNDPFSPGTTIADELSYTVENCDIDYATISDAYIDSAILILPDTLLVDWAIVDANDTTIVPAIYVLSGGSGNYYLQLDLFCPQKSADQFFVVTEGIGFNNGTISLLGVTQNDALSITLLPNPTSGLVTIQLNSNEAAQLNVFDLQGKVILSRKIKSNDQVSLDKLNPGTYLFEITSNNEKHITRVVKY